MEARLPLYQSIRVAKAQLEQQRDAKAKAAEQKDRADSARYWYDGYAHGMDDAVLILEELLRQ